MRGFGVGLVFCFSVGLCCFVLFCGKAYGSVRVS